MDGNARPSERELRARAHRLWVALLLVHSGLDDSERWARPFEDGLWEDVNIAGAHVASALDRLERAFGFDRSTPGSVRGPQG